MKKLHTLDMDDVMGWRQTIFKWFLIASAIAGVINSVERAQAIEPTHAFECAIVKITPPDTTDKDPSYKINVLLTDTQFVQVQHTTKSGATYYRGGQYKDTGSGPSKDAKSFADAPLIWTGTFKKDPRLSMYAWIGWDPKIKKLRYVENIVLNKKTVRTIESHCHEIELPAPGTAQAQDDKPAYSSTHFVKECLTPIEVKGDNFSTCSAYFHGIINGLAIWQVLSPEAAFACFPNISSEEIRKEIFPQIRQEARDDMSASQLIFQILAKKYPCPKGTPA